MAKDYYEAKLSADRLKRCYALAPARVQQYLKAEIGLVMQLIRPGSKVLELGCGYGRVLVELAATDCTLFGLDTALESLQWALAHTPLKPFRLVKMNAARPGFKSGCFDLVFCIQNGLAVFAEDPEIVISEAVRMVKPGGTVLFTSYSPRFWEPRLEWFQLQAAHGLLGEIDEQATSAGEIVCKDGFRAATLSAARFHAITAQLGLDAAVFEVDDSAVVCRISV